MRTSFATLVVMVSLVVVLGSAEVRAQDDPAVVSLTFSPDAIVGGSIQTADAKVTIAPAPTQTTIVKLSANPADLVSVGDLAFSPGQTERSFRLASFTVVPEATVITITAQLNGSVSAPFTVLPLRVAFAPSPASIVGGSAERTTVTLTSNAPVIFQQTDTVDVSADSPLMGPVGLVSLNIREGETNKGSFERAAAPVGAATVVTFTGRIQGVVVGTGSVTVNPLHVDLTVSPATLVGGSGQTTTLTVSPNAPLRSDLLPTLEASPPLIAALEGAAVTGPRSFAISAAAVAQTTVVTITSHLVITVPTIPPQPPEVITFLVGSTELTVLPLSCLQNPAAPECQVSPPPPPTARAAIEDAPSELLQPSVFRSASCTGITVDIPTTLSLRTLCRDIETGAIVPSCNVQIAVRATANSGGHEHGPNETRPAGTFAPASGNTGTEGVLLTTYTAPEVSGSMEVTVTGTLADGTPVAAGNATIRVGIGGLVSLPATGDGFEVTESVGHSNNRAATPAMKGKLEQVPKLFRESLLSRGVALGSIPALVYTSLNLPEGGLFDVDANPEDGVIDNPWGPPHCGHRTGGDADLRVKNVLEEFRKDLVAAIKDQKLRTPVRGERPQDGQATHWHLTVN